MSYHIYTTEGIILKRNTSAEADIVLHILTKDLGLVIASAKSARLSVSKLRGSLQEYSNIRVSIIKGKSGWKVTNVGEGTNFFFSLPIYSRKLLAQVSLILLKMIVGEYPQKDIYELVKNSFSYVAVLDKSQINNLEVLTILRILYLLGYVEGEGVVKGFLLDINFNEKVLKEVEKNKKEIILVINKALRESQL